MYASKLTGIVIEGQKDPSRLQNAEWAVALWIYTQLHNKFKLDPDEAGNFFCEFYPKIRKIITQFEYRGYPFEAYLYISLRWQVLSYKKRLHKERLERQLSTYEPFWDVHQDEPEYSEPITPYVPKGIGTSFPTFRKRLIYVAFRESEYLNNELIEEIIQFADIDRRWFLNCIMALRRKIEKRKKRLERVRLFHNSCFYRYYILQLKVENCNSPLKERAYRNQLQTLRARLRKVSRQLKHIHVHPTNREISEVLNIPKGSIDSGIYYALVTHKQKSHGPVQRTSKVVSELTKPLTAPSRLNQQANQQANQRHDKSDDKQTNQRGKRRAAQFDNQGSNHCNAHNRQEIDKSAA